MALQPAVAVTMYTVHFATALKFTTALIWSEGLRVQPKFEQAYTIASARMAPALQFRLNNDMLVQTSRFYQEVFTDLTAALTVVGDSQPLLLIRNNGRFEPP